MKNKFIISSTSVLAGMALGYALKRSMDQMSGQDLYDEPFERELTNAGKPDQVDSTDLEQLENAKMVSEGSQFGVQYYNEIRDDNAYDEAGLPKME